MPANRQRRQRCAIYTRKSSEEGLDQEFNSLHAQREACEAYIKSQFGEGWQLIRSQYDDGGISGGTLDQPALRQLLADIRSDRVDTVIVYKVDRLTRSLADFAKIVEVFDAHGVSFVSVTQQFNTTTSMGRLTLNMLLSFAQFEREVTGERIRDKIAASKKKGMWMGGFVPLGYDAKDRSLVINDMEAETVRKIYQLYLEHGNVRCVKAEADRLGLKTKVRETCDGKMRGGRPLSRGYIYKLLSNPLYIGRISHKGTSYDGQHAPIIDDKTWQTVKARLTDNSNERRSGSRAAQPSLLAGLIYDEHGRCLSPTHASKAGRRYRYYVSRNLIAGDGAERNEEGYRVPAHEIETLVVRTLERLLNSRQQLFDLLDFGQSSPSSIEKALEAAVSLADALQQREYNNATHIQNLLDQVIIAENEVRVSVSLPGIKSMLGIDYLSETSNGSPKDPAFSCIKVPSKLRRCGGASRLIIDDGQFEIERKPDPALIKVITRAHAWFERLSSGKVQSAADIARTEGLTRSYVTRVIRLALLAPDITEAILNGGQPPDLSAKRLVGQSNLPFSWDDQRRILGFRQQ